MENLVVGIGRIVVRIPGCKSLKEKRSVIRSMQDRIKARFNVSVAEVGAQDEHCRSVIAIVLAGSDKQNVESTLQKIFSSIEEWAIAPVVEVKIYIEHYADELGGFSDLLEKW